MELTTDALRLGAAAGVLLAWLGLCLLSRHGRRRMTATVPAAIAAATAGPDAARGPAPILVAYASQTGYAEELAREAGRVLQDAGLAAAALPLEQLDLSQPACAGRILFIASTCGDGDAPDHAAAFLAQSMAHGPALGGLEYGLLALGDRSYPEYCGFGRRLDGWLRDCGARPLFEPVEVDNFDALALARWRRCVGIALAATVELDWQPAATARWTLAARQQLNPGSSAAPAWHLEFEPAQAAALPEWEPGDLAQVIVPPDPVPRSYSIASVPGDGRLHLLVRERRHPDGRPGHVSGHLARQLAPGEAVALRVRRHSNFRLGSNLERPLVLIANGTGLAGLMAHLRQRAARGDGRNWLLFGERDAERDYFYREELERWHREGHLLRLDLAFAGTAPRRGVEDLLASAAGALREWVNDGAAIYLCGSAERLAPPVEAVLDEVLGSAILDELRCSGRYRRDVY